MADRRPPRRLVALFALSLSLAAVVLVAPRRAGGDDDPPAQPTGPSTLSDVNTIAFINQQLEQQWKENNLKPSNQASEYEFLRRVFLDLIGRIPTAFGDPGAEKSDGWARMGELPYYLSRPQKSRRTEAIAYLLRHPDFAKHWANIWTVWLLTRTSPTGTDRDN